MAAFRKQQGGEEMFGKKQIIILELIGTLFLAVSCGSADVSEESQQDIQSQVDNAAVVLDQPTVSLENREQGVGIIWNEISGADGYFVYRKFGEEEYQKIANITDYTVVEYLDSEAAAGTTYLYTVRAYAGDQKSTYEGVEITTGIWQPAVKVAYANTEMTITWNQITGCEGYIVYRKEEGKDENYSQLETIMDSGTISYTDQDVVPGVIYTYTVRAFIGKDKSTYAGVTRAAIDEPVVTVKDVAEGIEVSWDEITEAEGYIVYRRKDGENYEIIEQLTDPKLTSYVDSDFVAGENYSYTVRAYIGDQKSSYSGVEIATELGRVTITLKDVSSGVQIEWNEVPAAEGYRVYKREASEEEYSLVNTINDVSIVTYTDQQVESGKTYYYSVRAFVGDEEGSYSGSSITLSGR